MSIFFFLILTALALGFLFGAFSALRDEDYFIAGMFGAIMVVIVRVAHDLLRGVQ